VVIGEAVEVELPIARLATRTLAIVIDAAVEIALLIAVSAGVGSLVNDLDPAAGAAVGIGIVVFVFLVWPVTFETLTRGRSPGKYALGLRVVRDDGGPIRFRHAFVRGLVGLAIEWPGLFFAPISWIVGATTMLGSSKAKRVGDLAAGTMVLTERLPDRGRYVAEMPPQLATWARSLDLTRVDDRLAMAIRQFLSRGHEMRPGPRVALGARLVDEVQRATAPPAPAGTSGWWYLRAVLAERRLREERKLVAQREVVALGAPTGAAYVLGAGVTPPPAAVPVAAAAAGSGYTAPA
jgi:uncharacterized RDD family membrane protein YckC